MAERGNKQNLQSKDNLSRMEFLFQASKLMAGRHNMLSAQYGQLCRRIGQKALLRMHRDMKRQICKRCSVHLVPNVTSELKVHTISTNTKRKHKEKHTLEKSTEIQLICNLCGYQRSFLTNVDPSVLESPESLIQTITLENAH